MTFREAARSYIADRANRYSTVKTYENRAARLDATLGSCKVRAITRRDVQDALNAIRSEGAAPATLRALRNFVHCVLMEHENAAAHRVRVAVPDSEAVSALSKGQAELLDAELARMGSLPADALRVLLGTGLRRGELLALRPTDWALDSRQLLVARSVNGPTKSGKSRLVDVPDALVGIIENRTTHPRLFDVQPRELSRVLDRACEAAGVPRVRVHDLRHTRLSLLLVAGCPALYVSNQAGHADPSFTLRVYGHLLVATRAQRRAWANL